MGPRIALSLSLSLSLSLLLLGLTAPSALAQNPIEPEPLDEQLAAYTPSGMRAGTMTPDGRWAYQAEGGTMVFVDTSDSANFELPDGNKRVPVGARNVLAAALLLDPAADPEPGDLSSDPESLLYIAGGRDGLWVMEADVHSSANRAWRVDDSGNTSPATQGSKRWCCDVATMRVGGTDYLLALFGSKNGPGDMGSRLRVYPLAAVRQVANSPTELGAEIGATYQIKISGHPQKPAAPSPTYGRGVAVAMAVDEYVSGGEDVADVYIAMGHHGLVKVAFTPQDMQPAPQWGPIFGSGSWYTDSQNQDLPAGKEHDLYGNLVYEDEQPWGSTVHREEYPFFADVAVFHGTTLGGATVHQLFVAVDHLWWLVFDLDDPQPWNHVMKIHHHEGVDVTVAGGLHDFRGVESRDHVPEDTPSACNLLEVVDHPVLGPHLVASAGGLFIHDLFALRFEGPTYEWDFSWGGGPATLKVSGHELLWYAIRPNYTANTYNHIDHLPDAGGQFLVLPPNAPDPGRLTAYHGLRYGTPAPKETELGMCKTLLAVASGTTTEATVRRHDFGHGRRVYSLSTSPLNPNLVLTGANDSQIPLDGFLITRQDGSGNWSFDTFYDQPAIPPYADARGPNGLLLDGDGDGQWLEPGQPGDRSYVLCGGNHPGGGNKYNSAERWQLLDLEVPPDFDTAAPERRHWWYVGPPRNRYGLFGRLVYVNATTGRDFDAWLAGQSRPERHLFGGFVRTPEGVLVDRDELLTHALQVPDDEDIELDVVLIPPVTTDQLVTHPEFNRMPASEPDAFDFWQTGEGGDPDIVRTWSPKWIQVKDPATGAFGPWVMAVPCNSVSANPDWTVYANHPGWLPYQALEDQYSHGMVLFWEMGLTQPDHLGEYWALSTTEAGVRGNSPLGRLIPDGPEDAKGNLWRIEPLRMTVGSAEKVFLFSCDMGGRLYVHEIQDILSQTDPTVSVHGDLLFARWEPPKGEFDGLHNSVFDVEIDYRGGETAMVYVAVRRLGVLALRFDPQQAQPADRLMTQGHIQTAEHATALHLRENLDGSRHLLVSDYGGGIRLYGAPEE